MSQKIPVVDTSQNIIGVAGLAIPIAQENLLSFSRYLLNEHYTKKPSFQWEKKKAYHYQHLHFTYREAQCLGMMLRGATMAEIADKICRSRRTVEKHVASIGEKLGDTKHSFVFEKAIEYGFIELMFLGIK